MREPNDDGLVPPIKVLRKRLNGVYRADGLTGPTRRYVLIVAMLVGLASLPTLAAITAGSNELNDGTSGAMDVPFLPPPSSLPGTPRTPSPSPSAGAPPDGDEGPPAAAGEAVPAHAGKRDSKPRPSETDSRAVREESDDESYDPEKAPPTSPARPGTARPVSGGFSVPGRWRQKQPTPPLKPVEPSRPDRPAPDRPAPDRQAPDRPAPDRPAPDRPSRPGQPSCHDRAKCGSRPSHHHRPDWSRHRQCDNAAGSARADRAPGQQRSADRGRRVVAHRAEHRELEQFLRTVVSHRSTDRSTSSRRSSMAERPHNVRPSHFERTHNSRRHQVEARPDEGHGVARSYRGAHRAEHQYHADLSWDDHRSSRVGRRHAERRSP